MRKTLEQGVVRPVHGHVRRPELRVPADHPAPKVAAQELVADADAEDRHVDGVDPGGDCAERRITPLQAQRPAREDEAVGPELGPGRRVRDDCGLDVQVAEDAPLPVGPLAAVVDDQDLQGSSSRGPVVLAGGGVESRRSSSTAVLTSARSVRIRSISSSKGVNPEGDRIRAEM